VNPADTPIMVLAVMSDTLPLTTVDAYAENILLPKISQINGVGLVGIGGQQKPAIRVRVDPQALASRGISLEDVRNVLGEANVDWLVKVLSLGQPGGGDAVKGQALAIYAAVQGAQLIARSRGDAKVYDAIIDTYRESALLP